MNIKDYIAMARPSHWFKNLFVLPGTVIVLILSHTPISQIVVPLIIGLISVCLISSANYVVNGWVDAESDRFHPLKKNRPAAKGSVKAPWVYIEYVVLVIFGLGLALLVSGKFFAVSIFFLIMGTLYNIKPFRTKDREYLDVLSESINNPIRLALGWFIVTDAILPPSSLILGYWAAGAFLMNVKRYAEFRALTDLDKARAYRRSFNFYTEKKLLLLSFLYAMSTAFFLGVFLVKYRVELLFSLPFLAILFTWYLYIGMKQNSPAQHPEHLFQEKAFFAYLLFVIILLGALLFFDIPWMNWFLKNAFVSEAAR